MSETWPPTTTCERHGCGAPVIPVRLQPNLEIVEVDTTTGAYGTHRIRILTVQPDLTQPPLARRLANARQAFGVKLYRPHAETCTGQGGRKRTGAKAKSS